MCDVLTQVHTSQLDGFCRSILVSAATKDVFLDRSCETILSFFVLDYCMVCSTSFGIFTYKHICRACGNIVCSSCSPSSAMIQELSGPSAGNCGPQRVCSLCFWGQDAVFAVCYNLTHPKEKTSPQV